MRRFRRLAAVATVSVAMGSAAFGVAPAATASGVSVSRTCSAPARGQASCFALQVTGSPRVSAFVGPAGLHPADLISAYKLDVSKGTGQTIAIVDAFNNPQAEKDLKVYRKTFGLKPCTTANGCFRKVNQNGLATPLPKGKANWGEEIALDLDMASAICPKCHILLVEANSASFADLGTAVDRAALMGATVISNSYGGPENAGSVGFASHYNHPGIPITVSSGDAAYAAGPQVPAAFKTVTAVGGTRLTLAAGTRGWTETVWSGAGSGCSVFVAKPAWQLDTACAGRTIADVSAVADPATGVTVYDTYSAPGFLVFGGTSVSAPVIAGIYALAGNGATVNDASGIYSHTANLFDVTAGSNGSCGGTYLCTGTVGYDAPTGNGTPNGIGGF